MNELNDILLKGNEVAKKLNISRALAYRLMQSGEIPTIRFGGSVRVKQIDLDKFILDHRTITISDSMKD